MKHYIIVGRSIKSVKQKILDRGDEYTYLQDILRAKNDGKRYKRRLSADFSSKESVLESIRTLQNHFDGAIACYENYILPAAWITEELGLPGLPVEAALACTDKYLMRQKFAKAEDKISPDFSEVSSLDQVLDFARSHDYPLILKPANLAKSLLVTKSNSEQELVRNYQRTMEQIDAVYAKYSPHRQPKLIIEEFMTGSIHSVDAFVGSNGVPLVLDHIVDYQTGYDVGYEDNFHYSRLLPSKLPKDQQDGLKRVAAIGVRSLGMRNCPAHIEIIMTNEGPRIVEIGARNGGYRERMHDLANGLDILGSALELCVGKTPVINPTKNEPCAVLELFPKVPGVFTGITEEDALRKLPSLKYLSIKAKPQQFVGKSSDGYKMCAIVILHNSDTNQFNKDLEFVSDRVAVQTNPPAN